MAKGNLFQGMAHGVVGDVVFYRLNGMQMSRVRNRQPRNANTDAQLYQRAIMATVMRAYSAGKAIFDHSFEGVAPGSDSQAKFMSLNLKKLRTTIANDIAAGLSPADCNGCVVSRGSNMPVPWSYIVSDGTLRQDLFNIVIRKIGQVYEPYVKINVREGEQGLSVSMFLNQHDVRAGDIFTILGFDCENRDWNVYDDPLNLGFFAFTRLIVRQDAITSTKLVSQAMWGDIFYLSKDSADFPYPFLGVVSGLLCVGMLATQYGRAACGSIGVIRSAVDSSLRSPCTLVCGGVDASEVPNWGLKSPYILQNWAPDNVSLGESGRILEGGTI